MRSPFNTDVIILVLVLSFANYFSLESLIQLRHGHKGMFGLG